MSARLHVDFVSNDWAGSRQERLAILTENPREPGLLVELRDADRLELGYFNRYRTLTEVVEHLQGSYFFASAIHPESECPWEGRDIIPMRRVQTADTGDET